MSSTSEGWEAELMGLVPVVAGPWGGAVVELGHDRRVGVDHLAPLLSSSPVWSLSLVLSSRAPACLPSP